MISGAAIVLTAAAMSAAAWCTAPLAHANESTYLSLVHSRDDISAPDPVLLSVGYQSCADARARVPKDTTLQTIDGQIHTPDRIAATFVYNAALINLCPGVQAGP